MFPSTRTAQILFYKAGLDTGILWRSIEHAFFKPVQFYCTALRSDSCHDESYGYNYPTYIGVMLGKYLVPTDDANPVVQAIKIGLTAITLALIAVAHAVTCLLECCAALPVAFLL
mmetsp:Transcript_12092/g.33478  ORF Transcript_12092/g.33478 Transcript_12092/m.33478 type:complete len:115 (+) Transcript_12092:1285-1629(+)